jgi:hypothetical protein
MPLTVWICTARISHCANNALERLDLHRESENDRASRLILRGCCIWRSSQGAIAFHSRKAYHLAHDVLFLVRTPRAAGVAGNEAPDLLAEERAKSIRAADGGAQR